MVFTSGVAWLGLVSCQIETPLTCLISSADISIVVVENKEHLGGRQQRQLYNCYDEELRSSSVNSEIHLQFQPSNQTSITR
jgi:hypothetical protein